MILVINTNYLSMCLYKLLRIRVIPFFLSFQCLRGSLYSINIYRMNEQWIYKHTVLNYINDHLLYINVNSLKMNCKSFHSRLSVLNLINFSKDPNQYYKISIVHSQYINFLWPVRIIILSCLQVFSVFALIIFIKCIFNEEGWGI